MKFVYIHWLDAQGDHGQSTEKELEEVKSLQVETAGFYISEDKEVIRVATDILHFEGSKLNFESGIRYRCTNVIPKNYIIEMRVTDIPDA